MTNINLPPGKDFDPDSHSSTQRSVIHERLRQARLSFNLTLVLTATSGVISLVGVALLLSGKVAEGTVTTTGGITSNIVIVRCLKLTKDVNDRLDQMAKDLKDEA